MKLILLTFISLFLLSCSNTTDSNKDDKPETEWATQEPKPAAQVDVTSFKTKSGKEFTVVEKKRSGSLSRITIQGTGFPNSQEIYTLRDVDPFEAGLQGDLNNDGFEELYLITRATGSGSYAKIYGYASYNDMSYGSIYLAEPVENDPNFRGYMGHDRISIISNRIVREFPVYNMGDSNNAPSGGYRIIKYTLEKGEASFILKIDSVTSRARKPTPPS